MEQLSKIEVGAEELPLLSVTDLVIWNWGLQEQLSKVEAGAEERFKANLSR